MEYRQQRGVAFAAVLGAHAVVTWGFQARLTEGRVTMPRVVEVSFVTAGESVRQPRRAPALSAPPPVSEPAPAAVPEVAPAATLSETQAASEPPATTASSTKPSDAGYVPPRFDADYLNNPPPAYPLLARRRGIEGRALVRAEIHADGHCGRAETGTSSGHEMLDQAALEAVRRWRFRPARRGGEAVTAWVEIPIVFRLSEAVARASVNER